MKPSKAARLKYKNKRFATLRGHVENLMACAKRRSVKYNVPFNLDLDYLESIAVVTCPILGLSISWGVRSGKQTDNSPSLDRLDPTLGYVKGNVYWLCNRANTIKNSGNASEHELIAKFMRSKE